MLSQTVTKGQAPTLSVNVDPATNRITTGGYTYDSNGNLTAMPLLTMSYNVDNRLAQAVSSLNGTDQFVYDPQGQRVAKNENGSWKVYFYGVDGNLLGVYGGPSYGDYNIYFGRKLIYTQSYPAGPVVEDRLASTVKHFPCGEEPSTTNQNRMKFATYYRDATTALDYAQQRYYARTIGRFTSPDPLGGSLVGPQTLNRYAYVVGDPVNGTDPSGLCEVAGVWHPDGGLWCPNVISQTVVGTLPPPAGSAIFGLAFGFVSDLNYAAYMQWELDHPVFASTPASTPPPAAFVMSWEYLQSQQQAIDRLVAAQQAEWPNLPDQTPLVLWSPPSSTKPGQEIYGILGDGSKVLQQAGSLLNGVSVGATVGVGYKGDQDPLNVLFGLRLGWDSNSGSTVGVNVGFSPDILPKNNPFVGISFPFTVGAPSLVFTVPVMQVIPIGVLYQPCGKLGVMVGGTAFGANVALGGYLNLGCP